MEDYALLKRGIKNEMDWMKKHSDLITILTSFALAMLWMNGKFNEIEKEITIIRTVMIMKNIMPAELCNYLEKKE
jgi:hypothetical protein